MIDLPDIKQLEKVIDLCRKKGVDTVTFPGGFSLKFGDKPEGKPRGRKKPEALIPDPENPLANFPTGELTMEQLTYYSSGGMPENDPFIAAMQNKAGQT